MKTECGGEWKKNIAINVDNIISVSTENIDRYQVGPTAYVDITLRMVAMIDPSVEEQNVIPSLITLNAEFTKAFSESSFGDWSISKFSLNEIKSLN